MRTRTRQKKPQAQIITPLEPIDPDPEAAKVCSICQIEFTGWGNNAWPVNEGTCCKNCNAAVVIVARLNQIARAEKSKKA